jgi:hypothetical protein
MLRTVLFSLLAAVPTSSNYVLQTYNFGNGSGSGSSSNYSLEGTAGTASGTISSASYTLPAGINASNTLSAPAAPALTNSANSYNSLKIVINPGSAPSDTRFAIAISSDNFTTTRYVKADQTTASTFSVANYQTYANWGGSGGAAINGLIEGTAYKAKIAALQGSATGSAFGPSATASTSLPTVTFGLETSLTVTPPFSSDFTSLPPGTVTGADATITTTITSNAQNGGNVLIRSQNAGLTSSTAGFTIPSATADLSSANNGYGAQITNTSESSGGPMVSTSPFNNSSNNVGGLTTSWQQLGTFAAPITSGSLTFGLIAKSDAAVPAANNYTDIVTLSISLLF